MVSTTTGMCLSAGSAFISVIVAIAYLAAFFAPSLGLPAYWQQWAIGIPVLLFVLLVLLISGWIGWTMLTTPPPTPLEPEPMPASEGNSMASVSTPRRSRTTRRRKK